jgi:hypothetical protein
MRVTRTIVPLTLVVAGVAAAPAVGAPASALREFEAPSCL